MPWILHFPLICGNEEQLASSRREEHLIQPSLQEPIYLIMLLLMLLPLPHLHLSCSLSSAPIQDDLFPLCRSLCLPSLHSLPSHVFRLKNSCLEFNERIDEIKKQTADCVVIFWQTFLYLLSDKVKLSTFNLNADSCDVALSFCESNTLVAVHYRDCTFLSALQNA